MIVSGKDFREIDYSEFKVCLVDPPWDYNDKNPAVQKEQITYSRWDNQGAYHSCSAKDLNTSLSGLRTQCSKMCSTHPIRRRAMSISRSLPG